MGEFELQLALAVALLALGLILAHLFIAHRSHVVAHPEARCQRCGRPNPTWFAPSPIWNAAMRPAGEASERWSIVCPSCFAELAEASGIVPTAWRFAPEGE